MIIYKENFLFIYLFMYNLILFFFYFCKFYCWSLEKKKKTGR